MFISDVWSDECSSYSSEFWWALVSQAAHLTRDFTEPLPVLFDAAKSFCAL